MILLIIGILEFCLIIFIAFRKCTIDYIKKYIKNNIVSTIVFMITVLFLYIFILKNDYFAKIIDGNFYFMSYKMGLLILCFGISMLVNIIFIAIIQKVKERNLIMKYEKKETDNKFINYEYYRETLGKIPPAVLAICYNRKINFDDIFISTLLDLELQKKIIIEKDSIKIVCDIKKLHNFERFILGDYSYLNSNDQKIINDRINELKKELFSKNILSDKWVIKNYFYDELINEMIKMGYIYNRDDVIFNTGFIDIIAIYVMIYFFITMPILTIFPESFVMVGIGFALTMIYIIFQDVIKNRVNSIVRKQKALELSAKLNGLKNFYKDFSLINNNQVSDIKLYEENIIYAIIFDLKGNLNEQCSKIYNKVLKFKNINIVNNNDM